MGQTLSHGVYLPAEGERNCYSGLASNWNLLDTAIGDTAGKASATHTHGNITTDGKVGTTANLPLITGTSGAITTGSFGNQANTFCEGNDSRLSDARTPVAHTHGKADITDLFNSANTWTALNSYNQPIQITANFDIGAAPSSDVYGGFNFGNGTSNIGNITSRINSAGATYSRLHIGNKFANGALDPNGTWKYVELQVGLRANGDRFIYTDAAWRNNLLPYDSTVSIGDSTHQWNSLYAKNYYYNGTAWGLDKDNTWTGNNTFSDASNCVLSFEFGSSGSYSDIRYYDSNNSNYACLRSKVTDLALGLKYSSASNWYDGASVVIRNDGNVQIKSYDGTENWTVNFTPVGVYPTSDKTLELGTSTHEWKTLNGVNPGALSLPDTYTNLDTTNWDLTGTLFSYTPPIDGWLFVNIRPANNYAYVALEYASMRNNSESTTGKNAMACIAVRANTPVSITLSGASIAQARLVRCAGNV